MTHQNERRSASESKKRPVFYRSLANFLALSLFSNLSPIAPSPQASRSALGHRQQSAHETTGLQNSAGDEEEVRPLERGRPVKRELSGAQRHNYSLRLSANQFLKAIIEQRKSFDMVELAELLDRAKALQAQAEELQRKAAIMMEVLEEIVKSAG